jgi:hypothetical protein
MANEHTLTLQGAYPTRADYALIESNLKFIASQLAQRPTQMTERSELWRSIAKHISGHHPIGSNRVAYDRWQGPLAPCYQGHEGNLL